MTYDQSLVGAHRAAPPHNPSPTEMIESLIVDLLTEARRQLDQLSRSRVGDDTDDDRKNRENVKLRAINARTLASIVEIVRKVMDLQLQLEKMASIASARRVGSARAALQRKIGRILAGLEVPAVPAVPDG
jgi:hypothetical protein